MYTANMSVSLHVLLLLFPRIALLDTTTAMNPAATDGPHEAIGIAATTPTRTGVNVASCCC